MNVFKKSLVLSSITVLLIGMSGAAQAEYRLKAFGGTLGYRAIISGDAVRAVEVFENRRTSRMDFLELNNLCVAQILNDQLEEAIISCESALQNVGRFRAVTSADKRHARASIYSNIAVAKAKNGDFDGANEAMEMARTHNGQDQSINSNRELILENLVAAN